MIPVQMNPMATQGLAEMYRQQRAMMEQAREIQQVARTGQVESTQSTQAVGAVQSSGFGDVLNHYNEAGYRLLAERIWYRIGQDFDQFLD